MVVCLEFDIKSWNDHDKKKCLGIYIDIRLRREIWWLAFWKPVSFRSFWEALELDSGRFFNSNYILIYLPHFLGRLPFINGRPQDTVSGFVCAISLCLWASDPLFDRF